MYLGRVHAAHGAALAHLCANKSQMKHAHDGGEAEHVEGHVSEEVVVLSWFRRAEPTERRR